MTTERHNAHEAIDKYILNGEYGWSHKYISDEAVPYCDITNKKICSPIMPPVINPEADRIIRAKNEHEAGHARLTPSDKAPTWSPIKGLLVNVLEDLRIEKGVAKLSKAFGDDFNASNRHFIDIHQRKFLTGEYNGMKPVNEAIMALHFSGNGIAPKWSLSKEATEYYEKAKAIFDEWQSADCDTKKGFTAIEDIADRVLKALEEARESMNQGNSSSDSQDDKSSSEEGESSNDTSSEGESSNDSSNEEGESSNEEGESSNEEGESSSDTSSDSSSEEGGDSDATVNATPNDSGCRSMTDSAPVIKSLMDDFSSDDYEKEAIDREFSGIMKESKDLFGDYVPYTDEDETVPATENKTAFNRAFAEIKGTTSRLASYLQQSLKTMSRTRTIANCDRGCLDIARNTAKIAKSMSKDIFYRTTTGVSLDTVVTILVDESGSIGRYMSAEFIKLTVAFAEVLERLGIRFEIIGHTTGNSAMCDRRNPERSKFSRTESLLMLQHKAFNSTYARDKYRIGSISAISNNLDGEALMVAYRNNMAQRAKRHLIFVLSDGEPCAHGDVDKMFRNLKDTVKYCRENGAEIYAFGIGTEGPKKFYGEKYFVYTPSSDGLTDEFFKRTSDIILKGKMAK